MKCPNDGALLQMTEREGIEIDYCPTCRGIFLDRGELDKIIERAGSEYGRPTVKYDDPRTHDNRDDDNRYTERRHNDERRYDKHYSEGQHKKKKEGFLGDLFDF
ncbi:MAG TPA: zf-TFIIB domain-containing protein [Candidatus Saccharimonadales bacterium]|nr:zf-TFIIB domain-containing protein [Candidatus Saccharimonadales bacterium]